MYKKQTTFEIFLLPQFVQLFSIPKLLFIEIFHTFFLNVFTMVCIICDVCEKGAGGTYTEVYRQIPLSLYVNRDISSFCLDVFLSSVAYLMYEGKGG